MFTRPPSLPISVSGSTDPTILTATPESLSDYFTPSVTDPMLPIKFMIENILLTNPGERLGNPSFGIGLRSLLFEPRSSFAGVESRIQNQLNSYIPDINVYNVSVLSDPLNENALSVSISFLDPNRRPQNYVVSTENISNQGGGIYA